MKIYFSTYFKQQLKKLKRKYPLVVSDFLRVVEKIDLDNEVAIGHSIYKVRVQSSDMKRGKSGGFLAYVYFYLKKDLLVPLCIYAKSERVIVGMNELQYYFQQAILELLESGGG